MHDTLNGLFISLKSGPLLGYNEKRSFENELGDRRDLTQKKVVLMLALRYCIE